MNTSVVVALLLRLTSPDFMTSAVLGTWCTHVVSQYFGLKMTLSFLISSCLFKFKAMFNHIYSKHLTSIFRENIDKKLMTKNSSIKLRTVSVMVFVINDFRKKIVLLKINLCCALKISPPIDFNLQWKM